VSMSSNKGFDTGRSVARGTRRRRLNGYISSSAKVRDWGLPTPGYDGKDRFNLGP
jgi:hypothetical protein